MTWHDDNMTWHNMTLYRWSSAWPSATSTGSSFSEDILRGSAYVEPRSFKLSIYSQHTQLTCLVYIVKQLQLSFYKFSNHIVQSVLQCHLVLALIFLLKRNLVFSLKRNRGFQVQNTMKPKVWLLIWLSSHRVADCLVQVCAQSGHSLVGIVDSGHHVLEGFLAVICGWKSW